ncbi:phosphatase PAP2 family protein [Promicromonospora sp. NPDC059942]|uniref:phosphatase PAP2 family protein n=1 Tax=Promicromonospora sp. NPDC059942 TaxID=3347009 RepID=UPI00364C0619
MPATDGRMVRPAGSRTGADLPQPAPSRGAPPSTTRLAALTVAFAAALGTLLVWWAMVTTWPGQRVEERVFVTADLFQDVVNRPVEPVLLLGSPPWLVTGFLAVCGVGLARRRWGATALAAAVILGSNLTTQVIKDGVFYRTGLVGEWNRDINTLPSGHVTVVAAAWAALLLVAPRRWRPATALAGAILTCAMGLATIADRWHRPSDVVAAVLVVVLWTALAGVATPAGWADRPEDDPLGSTALPTRLVAVVLGVAAVPAAVLSVLAAAATEGRLGPGLPWDAGLVAYAGGHLAACAVAAAAFAVLLPLTQAAARPR